MFYGNILLFSVSYTHLLNQCLHYSVAVEKDKVCVMPFLHEKMCIRDSRKKALEASDISSLVRETERSLQGGTLPNAQQKTRIFFVLMYMLRGIPFVDLAYLHKRDLQGNIPVSYTHL